MIVVELEDEFIGRGESVPYPHYGESLGEVAASIKSVAGNVENGQWGRTELQREMPPGAARNALDCAMWDLETRRQGVRLWQLAGEPEPQPLTTAYTLSLGSPEEMGRAAQAEKSRPLLKAKLGGDSDLECMIAIRENAPDSRLIVDANEGWSVAEFETMCHELASLDVSLIEQPLPSAEDHVLERLEHPVPLCADESCHTRADINRVRSRYDFVNIKLDKAGGLTEAMAIKQAARNASLGVMVGCMVGTSLAMAPAVLLAQGADFVDLDGPLLLAKDRQPVLRYAGSLIYPPVPELWG